MPEVRFIDVSVRDAPQSLWATRITNDMILPFAGRMDEMGFAWIDLVGGAVFDVCVRYLHEDPWERMRLMAQRVKRTPLNVWTRGQSIFTFEFFSDDIVELAIQRYAANGMKRHTFYDSLNDIRNIELAVKATKAAGLYCCAGFSYTISPVHTDEYFAAVARGVAAFGPDAFIIKDPSGLMTPERVKTLVPAVKAAIGALPLEMHSHCRSGMAEPSYIEAVQRGVAVIHTAISPMAGGASLPPTEYFVQNLPKMGFTVRPRLAELAEMADYFTALARLHDKPLGVHGRYDPGLYRHHIPGGMISNLEFQLGQLGIAHRLDEVLEEAARVREDLGYPCIVSPFAQFVVTQSVINVVRGERFATIPDEILRYVLGYYGKPAGPIAPHVMDRVCSLRPGLEPITERAGALVEPAIPRLRRERGPFRSDDDLLLAAFYRPAQLEPLFLARDDPARQRGWNLSVRSPLDWLLAEIAKRPRFTHVAIAKGDTSIEIDRAPLGAAAE
ncbi:MAG: pyruvate carboxylase subunit B [Alphaproteobacteria bacterium]|nr:pyruvate carboxylase subunit B [Alphaproteobacteria bacterium]